MEIQCETIAGIHLKHIEDSAEKMSNAIERLAEHQEQQTHDLRQHEMSDNRIQAEILASIEALKDRLRQS